MQLLLIHVAAAWMHLLMVHVAAAWMQPVNAHVPAANDTETMCLRLTPAAVMQYVLPLMPDEHKILQVKT
jgi:hypothetical protein